MKIQKRKNFKKNQMNKNKMKNIIIKQMFKKKNQMQNMKVN